MSSKIQWIAWLVLTAGLVGYLAFSLVSQPSASARTFLPGKTTHGHYQIELQCNECHSKDFGAGVSNDACTRCHGDDLEQANDTHPKSKFTDPGLKHLVEQIDGRSCLSCHQEHVPDRTLVMGLSLPADYCWHCHQDIGEQRPSHVDLAYDSCASAGCHNYHDNRALFEKFLVKHHGEPDMLDLQALPARNLGERWREKHPDAKPLSAADHDAPAGWKKDDALLADWASTAHAQAGINCSACHVGEAAAGEQAAWSDKLSHQACRDCHTNEVETFVKGRHGMRLSVGLDPMTPGQARLPMNHDAFHNELTCVACHDDHKFDTQYAATDACLKCHADEHSLAYKQSAHYELWLAESKGDAPANTGVSCASCHMPREKSGGVVSVQHNQNDNLRPNEKMARSVCANCHGLQYTLDALADVDLVRTNFQGQPTSHVESLDMAKSWSDERARLRAEREKARAAKKAAREAAAKQDENQ